MGNDLSDFAKKLSDMLGGNEKKKTLENVMRILSTDSGKKVMASLLSDGGESVKRAAEAAKNGDIGGVEGIISAMARTPDGEKIISELKEDLQRSSGR